MELVGCAPDGDVGIDEAGGSASVPALEPARGHRTYIQPLDDFKVSGRTRWSEPPSIVISSGLGARLMPSTVEQGGSAPQPSSSVGTRTFVDLVRRSSALCA